jgi:hypothetical protein
VDGTEVPPGNRPVWIAARSSDSIWARSVVPRPRAIDRSSSRAEVVLFKLVYLELQTLPFFR